MTVLSGAPRCCLASTCVSHSYLFPLITTYLFSSMPSTSSPICDWAHLCPTLWPGSLLHHSLSLPVHLVINPPPVLQPPLTWVPYLLLRLQLPQPLSYLTHLCVPSPTVPLCLPASSPAPPKCPLPCPQHHLSLPCLSDSPECSWHHS